MTRKLQDAPRRLTMTARDWFWLLFVFVPLAILWIFVVADAIKRPDLIGWQKGVWVAFIIFFPWIGALIYLIARPANPMETRAAEQMPTDATSPAATSRVPMGSDVRGTSTTS
jgi:hypothetical protein